MRRASPRRGMTVRPASGTWDPARNTGCCGPVPPATSHCPCFPPEGRWLLVLNRNGVQQLWDLAERKLIRSWRGGARRIRADGREIAAALADGTIEIRETSTGQMLRHFPTNPGG